MWSSHECERFLIDGAGFHAADLADATPIHFRDVDRSLLWSRFDGPTEGTGAIVPLVVLESTEKQILARWAGRDWSFRRRGESIDFGELFDCFRDLRVAGGPWPAVRVLWRDTGQLVSHFGWRVRLFPWPSAHGRHV